MTSPPPTGSMFPPARINQCIRLAASISSGAFRKSLWSLTVQGLVALAWLAAPPFASAEDAPRVLADKEFFTKGSFIAYAGPWSTYFGTGMALKHGVDYADEIALHPDAFPADVELSWHWPLATPKNAGVYGYNALSFGNYDGGSPQVPVEPRQVKAVGTLTETFRFTMPRSIGDYNVLSELFLTPEKGTEKKVAEVGFLLRPAQSGIAFADAGEQLGTFTDASAHAWKVAKQAGPQGPYYMFMPAAPVLSGTIDFKAALDFLRAKSQLTGEEWFNGLAFGVEPEKGSGSIHVEVLSVSYQ